jgi:hypothetical protein
MLEIYFFTFLFVLGLFMYGSAIYLKAINENERDLCKWLLIIPIICITLIVI